MTSTRNRKLIACLLVRQAGRECACQEGTARISGRRPLGSSTGNRGFVRRSSGGWLRGSRESGGNRGRVPRHCRHASGQAVGIRASHLRRPTLAHRDRSARQLLTELEVRPRSNPAAVASAAGLSSCTELLARWRCDFLLTWIERQNKSVKQRFCPIAVFVSCGFIWWAVQDSNLRPPACKAGALTN